MSLARLAPAGLCLLAVLAAGCVLDVPYAKFAIVYGISDYETINDLQWADADAISIGDMLDGQGYKVLPWVRTNLVATKAQLLSDIASIGTEAKENDLFLFFFSGHGDQTTAGPEPASGDSPNENIYLNGPDMVMTDDELVTALATIPCKRKVLILDSCFSGGFIGNALEVDSTPPSLLEGGQSRAASLADAISLYANFDGSSADIPPWEAMVISASGERESAYESPDRLGQGPLYSHGVFTYFLLQAEQNGDRNGDGYVTVTEAYDYVRNRIKNEWNLRNGYSIDAFSPHVSGGPVDYVLFQTR